jgi:hypothetical protein
MTLTESLLACFARPRGAGDMLNIHDLKAAYEQANVDPQQHGPQSSGPARLP